MPLQNLPKNVGYLGKLIVAKGFKKLPKVQQIAHFGHTEDLSLPNFQTNLLIVLSFINCLNFLAFHKRNSLPLGLIWVFISNGALTEDIITQLMCLTKGTKKPNSDNLFKFMLCSF